MTLKTIALAFLLCVFAIPAFADAAKNAKDAAAAKLLYQCETSEDCLVVNAVCPNTWAAINKNREMDHTAMIERWRPTVSCLAANAEAVKPTTATCENNICVLAQGENMTKMPGPYDCFTADDCVVAEGICPGWWISVNKTRIKDQEEYVKKNRPIVKCKKPISPDKPTESVCVENKCDVKQLGAKP